MKLIVVLTIGLIIGALDGIGIFYAPDEPYKNEIFIAAILNGALVSIIVAQSLSSKSSWWIGLLFGILYGFLFGIVIFLAKGGYNSMDAPFVVPSGIVFGGITGVLNWKFSIIRNNN